MDLLVLRLTDPAYARAYREWVDSLVERFNTAIRRPSHRPRATPLQPRGPVDEPPSAHAERHARS